MKIFGYTIIKTKKLFALKSELKASNEMLDYWHGRSLFWMKWLEKEKDENYKNKTLLKIAHPLRRKL